MSECSLLGILTEMVDTPSYYVDNSNIHGKGVFASTDLPLGVNVGKLHDISDSNYTFTELGKSYNHSGKPNCKNELKDNSRFLVTTVPISKGEELTADYRLQPDLEQPGINFVE